MTHPTAIQTNKLIGNRRRPAPPSQAKVAAMVDSIRTLGRIVEPLVVLPVADGLYEIVQGETRWMAAKQLNIEIIPIQVVPFDDHESSVVSVIGNLNREAIQPSEVVTWLESAVSEFGVNAAEIVMEMLPALREVAASHPEHKDRINAILLSCGVEQDEGNTDEA
ncbi:ParB/RepB/Spo0J family partition protein [Pseudomonas aeruginosa]|uniref:ParB/RepB/Spo0J family partition protein n=1 Tax=Pseudomonas aeruginosa TaxID=287 RepID=UPI0025C8C989|nr:ParB N-terminal domain-containing protein [Pseudomonas aeruginosa]